jgi:hypothetical protein
MAEIKILERGPANRPGLPLFMIEGVNHAATLRENLMPISHEITIIRFVSGV